MNPFFMNIRNYWRKKKIDLVTLYFYAASESSFFSFILREQEKKIPEIILFLVAVTFDVRILKFSLNTKSKFLHQFLAF